MQQGPQPRVTDVNRPFWDGCREGRLMLQRCADAACARFVFYPRVCCPYCGGGTLAWQEVSGTGRLQSWTVVHRPGHEAFMPDVPYLFAAVTLVEGPLMYGRLRTEADAPAPAIGARVRAVFPAVASGAVLPVFVLADEDVP